jgi:hypothetical protein
MEKSVSPVVLAATAAAAGLVTSAWIAFLVWLAFKLL